MNRNNNVRTVMAEHMRPDELLEAREKRSIVYLPVGPLEWHGPAMPFGTDPLFAQETARRCAAVTGGIVMPTLFFGTERERSAPLLDAMGFADTAAYIVGQDFPANSVASYYSKEDVFSLVVREYLRMLSLHKYRLIVIVNGHGADNQKYQLERLSVEFSHETDSRVLHTFTIQPLDHSDEDLGHATRLETSVMMALEEGDVDLSLLPPRGVKLKNCDWGIDDGCTYALKPNADKTVIYDPRDASAELGEKYLARSVETITDRVMDEWRKINGEGTDAGRSPEGERENGIETVSG